MSNRFKSMELVAEESKTGAPELLLQGENEITIEDVVRFMIKNDLEKIRLEVPSTPRPDGYYDISWIVQRFMRKNEVNKK